MALAEPCSSLMPTRMLLIFYLISWRLLTLQQSSCLEHCCWHGITASVSAGINAAGCILASKLADHGAMLTKVDCLSILIFMPAAKALVAGTCKLCDASWHVMAWQCVVCGHIITMHCMIAADGTTTNWQAHLSCLLISPAVHAVKDSSVEHITASDSFSKAG